VCYSSIPVVNGYVSEAFVSFQGEGVHVGRRQLFIRLSGCNLRCRYCDTPDSLERGATFRIFGPGTGSAEGQNPIAAAEFLSRLTPLLTSGPPIDGVSVTGGEPLLQPDFLAELLTDARLPRPRLLETNGMLPERLAAVLPAIDVVSMDIKLPSNTGEPEFWGAHRRFLSAASAKVYVKILVDRGTSDTEVERAAALVRDCAPTAPVFLQPITGTNGGVDIGSADLDRFFSAARAVLNDVRVLPQTHKMMGVH